MITRIFIGLIALALLGIVGLACAVWLGFGFTVAVIAYASDHGVTGTLALGVGVAPTLLAIAFVMAMWKLHRQSQV